MAEMKKLSGAVMDKLRSFGLRPGMSLPEIREALKTNRHHGASCGDSFIEVSRGTHLSIDDELYTPQQLQQLLDAQTSSGAFAPPSPGPSGPPSAENDPLDHFPGASGPEGKASGVLSRMAADYMAEAMSYTGDMGRSIWRLGRVLCEAKEKLPHGEWGGFMDEYRKRTGFGPDAVQRMMRLSREVEPDSLLTALPISKAFEILRLPGDEREDFARNHGEDSVREIRKLIAERDQIKKERDVLAGVNEKASARAAAAEIEAHNAKKAAGEWENNARELARENERLRAAPPQTVKVVEVPDDYAKIKSENAHLRASMEETYQAAEDLERQLADQRQENIRLRQQGGGGSQGDRLSEAQRLLNDFLIVAQLLPYDPETFRSEESRRQFKFLMEDARRWVLDAQRADMTDGPLAADGEVS